MSTEIIDQFFTREDWMRDGKCSGLAGPVASAIFFPPRGVSLAPARAVCGACPVREECLDYALRTSQKFGVWGGLSERERRGMRRTRRAELGLPRFGPIARLSVVEMDEDGAA